MTAVTRLESGRPVLLSSEVEFEAFSLQASDPVSFCSYSRNNRGVVVRLKQFLMARGIVFQLIMQTKNGA